MRNEPSVTFLVKLMPDVKFRRVRADVPATSSKITPAGAKVLLTVTLSALTRTSGVIVFWNVAFEITAPDPPEMFTPTVEFANTLSMNVAFSASSAKLTPASCALNVFPTKIDRVEFVIMTAARSDVGKEWKLLLLMRTLPIRFLAGYVIVPFKKILSVIFKSYIL